MDRECPKSTASYHPPSPALPGEDAADSGRVQRGGALAGQLLANRFELLELLGAGSFGEVYKARDRHRPGETLAIKVLRHPSPSALYRFKREFRALGELSHPNLAALHELFLDASNAFFSMELVVGVDFLSFVRPAGVLQTERLTHALRGLCDGVDALHAGGWLHRDLKPSNVLIETTGRVVIVDFGLATLLEPSAEGGSELGFAGTAQYAAPEQLSLGKIGRESDWYAIGTMLYEALSGALPYGASFFSLFDAKSSPPPALPELPERLRALADVCIDMLQPEPRTRAGGAALRAVLGEPPTEARVERELPFVGRAAELAALQQLFREVEDGAALGALVLAPSGLGKTSLVNRFLEELRARHGALVLRSRCYVNEEVAYQGIDGSIDALSHYLCGLPLAQAAALLPRDARSLATVFPVLSRVPAIATAPPIRALHEDRASLRERAAAALRELLGRLSDRVPLVLCVDDVQWDDADSAWLLATIFDDPDPPALLLIAICRSEAQEQSHLLRALRGPPTIARRVRELALPALSFAETLELAAQGGEERALDAHSAARVATESGGHPLFALELLRWAQHGHELDVHPAELSLDAAIRGRAAALSEAGRKLLELVCAAGHPIKCGVAARAGAGTPSALRELTARKLASASGLGNDDEVEVYHDRVREALLPALDDARRRALRVALAEALLAEPEPRFDVIVEHYLAGGEPQRAALYALQAAEHAGSLLAFHRVPALLELAIGAAEEQQRGALYVRLGQAYALVGRTAEAARAYEQAAQLEPEAAQRWELRCLAMWQAFVAGERALGFALVGELDAHFGRRGIRPTPWRVAVACLRGLRWYVLGPPKFRAAAAQGAKAEDRMRMTLAFRIVSGLIGRSAVQGLYYSVVAFQLSAELGDAGLHAVLLASLVASRSLASGRRSRRGERQLAQAVALVRTQPDRALEQLVAHACIASAYCSGQLLRAEQELRASLEAPAPPTPLGTFAHALLSTGEIPLAFWRGRIAYVRSCAARAIQRARELSDADAELRLRAASAFRLLADDDAETAWAEWARGREGGPDRAPSEVTWGVVPALYGGSTARAEQVLASGRRELIRWDAHVAYGRHNYLWWWGAVAAARLAAGETSGRLRLRLRLAAWAIGVAPLPLFKGLAACLRAMDAHLRGRHERASRQLEHAHTHFVAGGMRLFAACAAHSLAALHPSPARRSDYAAQAREVFDQERLARPERWLRALLPGLPGPEPGARPDVTTG